MKSRHSLPYQTLTSSLHKCVGAPPFRSINETCRADDAYFRAIGSVATDGFSLRRDLLKHTDALIFVDRSNPSALLPF